MRFRRRQLPFLPLVPAIVLGLGLAAAVAIAMLGAAHLHAQSDQATTLRSKLLSLTLSERLRAAQTEDRSAILERAARRSGAEILLVRQDGRIVVDGTLAPPSRNHLLNLLESVEGETFTELGRTRYFVAPLAPPMENLAVVTFVRAPDTPFAIVSLLTSIAALAIILIGAAALVAYGFARDVQSDVAFVRERIVAMAKAEGDPAGRPIPVRVADQIGLLTSAFNLLVERFATAEQAYRRDLAGALAYDRDRSAFLAALSHELRTPLNAILGFTEVLLSEVDGPLTAEARENLVVVRTSGEHLRSLIGDILDLSALESGELRLTRREIDVFVIGEEVVREAQITCQHKPLIVQIEGDHARANVDARRMRQILGNVVGNAVKFTTEGCVRVRIEPRGRFIAIVVSDTGPGIPRSEQQAIFEEYRQAGDASSRRVGTGLGLAITRRLVQMHGGFIELESAPGQGSRFTIVVPSEVEVPSTARPSEPPKLLQRVELVEALR